MKVLPDSRGVWSQCGTIHHVDNCWCYLDEGQAHTAGNICLYWQCVCGWEYCACGTCEGASLQLQLSQQGAGEGRTGVGQMCVDGQALSVFVYDGSVVEDTC